MLTETQVKLTRMWEEENHYPCQQGLQYYSTTVTGHEFNEASQMVCALHDIEDYELQSDFSCCQVGMLV